jgi:hypothetical protein
MDFILANWQTILVAALAVMGGLVVALMPLAKMTHTDWDNKILGWISSAVTFLSKFVTPKVAAPKE